MTIWLRQAVLFLHLLAAAFWVGEILFVALVIGPLARNLPPPERAELMRGVGRRTLPWIWVAIAILVVTGIGNLYFLGIGPRRLVQPAFYGNAFGWLLAAKLLAAAGMIAHAATHDLIYRRRMRRVRATMVTAAEAERPALEAEHDRLRRAAAAVGRGNLWLAIIVLALAAGLAVRT